MKRITAVIGIVIGIAATPTVVAAGDSNPPFATRPVRARPRLGHAAGPALRTGPGWAVRVRLLLEVGRRDPLVVPTSELPRYAPRPRCLKRGSSSTLL
jgi:hypothetical protein